ncbi:MAG: hypothetical protein ABH885_04500, partial [Candidatus Omnitrophota bacterium]
WQDLTPAEREEILKDERFRPKFDRKRMAAEIWREYKRSEIAPLKLDWWRTVLCLALIIQAIVRGLRKNDKDIFYQKVRDLIRMLKTRVKGPLVTSKVGEAVSSAIRDMRERNNLSRGELEVLRELENSDEEWQKLLIFFMPHFEDERKRGFMGAFFWAAAEIFTKTLTYIHFVFTGWGRDKTRFADMTARVEGYMREIEGREVVSYGEALSLFAARLGDISPRTRAEKEEIKRRVMVRGAYRVPAAPVATTYFAEGGHLKVGTARKLGADMDETRIYAMGDDTRMVLWKRPKPTTDPYNSFREIGPNQYETHPVKVTHSVTRPEIYVMDLDMVRRNTEGMLRALYSALNNSKTSERRIGRLIILNRGQFVCEVPDSIPGARARLRPWLNKWFDILLEKAFDEYHMFRLNPYLENVEKGIVDSLSLQYLAVGGHGTDTYDLSAGRAPEGRTVDRYARQAVGGFRDRDVFFIGGVDYENEYHCALIANLSAQGMRLISVPLENGETVLSGAETAGVKADKPLPREFAEALAREMRAQGMLAMADGFSQPDMGDFYTSVLGKKNVRSLLVFRRGFEISFYASGRQFAVSYNEDENFVRVKDGETEIRVTAFRSSDDGGVDIIMPAMQYEFLSADTGAMTELVIHELFEDNYPELTADAWDALEARGIAFRSEGAGAHEIAERLELYHTAGLNGRVQDDVYMSKLDWDIALFSYLLTGETAVSAPRDVFRSEMVRRMRGDAAGLRARIAGAADASRNAVDRALRVTHELMKQRLEGLVEGSSGSDADLALLLKQVIAVFSDRYDERLGAVAGELSNMSGRKAYDELLAKSFGGEDGITALSRAVAPARLYYASVTTHEAFIHTGEEMEHALAMFPRLLVFHRADVPEAEIGDYLDKTGLGALKAKYPDRFFVCPVTEDMEALRIRALAEIERRRGPGMPRPSATQVFALGRPGDFGPGCTGSVVVTLPAVRAGMEAVALGAYIASFALAVDITEKEPAGLSAGQMFKRVGRNGHFYTYIPLTPITQLGPILDREYRALKRFLASA